MIQTCLVKYPFHWIDRVKVAETIEKKKQQLNFAFDIMPVLAQQIHQKLPRV